MPGRERNLASAGNDSNEKYAFRVLSNHAGDTDSSAGRAGEPVCGVSGAPLLSQPSRYAVSMATADKRTATTLGFLALALAGGTLALWFRQVRLVAIPENRALFIACSVLAAVLGIAAFVKRTRWYGGLAALLGIVVAAFLPFTVAISRQEVAPNGIRVGETIPQFTALDDRGERFDSSRLAGQLVLIKFFRAHW